MRHFYRHPIDVPIEYQLEQDTKTVKENLKNVSLGGLCFISQTPMAEGIPLLVRFPLMRPRFEVRCVVVWCHPVDTHYEIGVRILDEGSEFKVRMVEQMCQIQAYREEILKKEGRKLSGRQAALEWIQKFAGDFPE